MVWVLERKAKGPLRMVRTHGMLACGNNLELEVHGQGAHA